MKGQLYIDGIDLYDEYGVWVAEGGFDELLAFPPMVDPEKNIWPEMDGVEVDLSNPTLSGKEVTIPFVASGPGADPEGLMMYVSRPGYRTVRVPALGREWRLRLLSQSSNEIHGRDGSRLGSFSLRFADDFPAREGAYEAPSGSGVSIPSSVYSLDGVSLENYGVVVEAGRDEMLASAAVRQNLTRNFRDMDGVLYDVDTLVFGEKDVTLNCCLIADTMDRFWECYTAFFNDLIKPGERSLGYAGTGKDYRCHYKSSSNWRLTNLNGCVMVEFSVTLVFTSFRVDGAVFLLATDDGSLVTTGEDNLVDVSWAGRARNSVSMENLDTTVPAVAASDTDFKRVRIMDMPEAASLEGLVIPAANAETNESFRVPVSSLGTGGGGGGLSGTLGGLLNVSGKADAKLEYGVVLAKLAGSATWDVIPVSDIAGGQQGIQRNLRISNGMDSKNVAASKGEPCPLTFTFVSQERYSVGEPFEDTGERGFCQISVKNSEAGDYVVVKEQYISSNQPFTLDVAEYLTSGANNVLVKATGEVTEETTPAFVYTVYLTSLSISASNFKWWTAYTGDITLPLNIGGNVSKKLFVTLTGEGYNESYETLIGTVIYTETAYNQVVPHPRRSGVFNLSAYVANSDGTIRTRVVSFQVICAKIGEAVKLVAVNNVLPKATNWAENTLFEYAMYDGGNALSSARFEIRKDGTQVFASDESSIATSTRHPFTLPLEIETMDNAEFRVEGFILDESVRLAGPIAFQVNNSLGYSATAGSVFYVNPKTRSNRQGNYLEVVNEIDSTNVPATWTGMNWGNDGWVADSDGNKTLRLMAGSSLALGYTPFKKECARTGKTIEVDYRVDNVTDFSAPVLTIASPSASSFVGLKLYADEVMMHSQSLRDSKIQGIHTNEGKRLRLTLVIMPDAYGNSGFNLCIIYIDGKKNREFTYENNDYFAQGGNIVIGSEYADIDIYGLRIYDSALTSPAVLRNYINWMVSTTDKEKVRVDNDVLDSNGSEVDFENTRDQYNVLVFDNTIPRMADPSGRVGTLEVCFCKNPEWNVSISNVEAKGQGTSSMKYYLWNTKYSIDKAKSVITYADGTTGKKTWRMIPGIPASAKFTAKKNFASSMQSHKMGSVNSVNDLYRELGFSNEAMRTAEYKDARVAVYQLPFVGFEKSINEDGETIYTFMGEYTFGPDKGDKYCFGYDTDLFPGLISIEGSDNSPLLTLFRVPWKDPYVRYNPDEEAFQYNGANAWDFDGGLEGNISNFAPAYNLVYSCSDRLRPFDGTPEELNAQAATYRTQPYEFWIAKAGDARRFDVYYFESSLNRFIPSDIGSGTINLKTQLADKGYGLATADLSGKSNDQLNTLFINARVAKFRKEAPAYWDIDDAILHRNWVEMHAGTDQRAKNTYCYSFGPGNKWKWRYDDMDTIFDTDNEGQPEKHYAVEIHDVNETGAAVWNGETNNFWNLVDLAFPEEVVTGMRTMLSAMQRLGGLAGGTEFDKLLAYYQKYYFTAAQEYFPANIVNADAKIAYEIGKLAYMSGSYTNDTDPITQSLGDHFSAETRWVTKRIVYMMSKYSFGMFSANGTDTISVRAAGNTIKYTLTPAIDLYPAIANGTSIIRGARTKAGEDREMLIELSGSGDQQNTIQGASYLQDIGDWHDKNVSGTMVIQGRMLREIRLGSKTDTVLISIAGLTISNCVSLQRLILSNIRTLGGTLNLSACSHLKEVYADGTALAQIKLPAGGGLQVVEFGVNNQYLSLSNYPLMTYAGVGINLCRPVISDFFIVDCPQITPVKILMDIMESQSGQSSHALKRVRAVGFDETYTSHVVLDKLAELADGSYVGLSSDGLAGEDAYPVLDGTLHVHANVYQDSIDALQGIFKKLNLDIIGKYYMRFRDNVALQAVAKAYGDGVGVMKDQLERVTGLFTLSFAKNTQLEYFDEFKYFTNINETYFAIFGDCTNLKSITFPDQLTKIFYNCCRGCTSLVSVHLPQNLDYMGGCAFWGCTSLTTVELPSGLRQMDDDVFRECKLKSIILPDSFEEMGGQCFRENLLTEITFPPKTKYIANMAFVNCRDLAKVVFKSTIPPVLGGGSIFNNCSPNLRVYVPDASLNAYKTAGYYKDMASKIYPISSLTE